MKRPTLRVLEYRHSKTHPWYLDLRPFNRGRKFFKTKAEAESERLRQITTLERHGREAVGLPWRTLRNYPCAERTGQTRQDHRRRGHVLLGLSGTNPPVQRDRCAIGGRGTGRKAQGWDEH